MAYNEFAYFYDEFNGEADYDALYSQIHTKLEAGDCVILLDAMDEIKSTEFSNFSKELNRFANDYPDNLYIMSSRPVSNFMRFRNFTVYNFSK